MSNVIGPFDQLTWYTMRQIHSSIKYMKKCGSNLYAEAIRKETDILDQLKQKSK